MDNETQKAVEAAKAIVAAARSVANYERKLKQARAALKAAIDAHRGASAPTAE